MKLHNYFRSGTSHRLRIALNLKGLKYNYLDVNLRSNQHLDPKFKTLNPQGFVPVLEFEDKVLIQSSAIIEWLEERYPQPPFLPSCQFERQHIRALAAIIGCDIHPINNRRILELLRYTFGADEDAIRDWCVKWISEGFNAFSELLDTNHQSGLFCFGDALTLADIYLIPQIESARRFDVDLSCWPKLLEIESNCMRIESFQQAAPSVQMDAF